MNIKQFSEFLTEPKKQRDSAGVAIVYDGKLLLVHPTNSGWSRATLGIPKGEIEEGEDIQLAAIRELKEETGIQLSADQLDSTVHTVDLFNKSNKYLRSIHYFVCRIHGLSEIGLDSTRVPKTQLQQEEVDWAGFIDIKEAYSKVTRSQLIILDRLS